MANHPINGLMETAMQSIKDMVDVNTIIGDPVQTPDGFVILPISKVSFGLAAGGGEYYGDIDFAESSKGDSPLDDKLITPVKYPFAGGSGAGVCITPVAFMVVGGGNVQLLPVSNNTVVEQLVKMVPDLFNKINNIISQNKQKKEQEEEDYSI